MKNVDLLLAGKKGLVVLQRLVSNNGYLSQINSVCIAKDTAVQNDYTKEIQTLVNKYNLKQFPALPSADYTIAIGWRKLIPDFHNLIVLHDSLLPKYRGFAPLVASLLNKDDKIGVTAFFAAEEVDTGAIIDQRSCEIKYPITIADAIDKVSILYADTVEYILSLLHKELPLPSSEQVGKISYSIWRGEDDYRINWSWDAAYICRFVDAVGYPYLGATSLIGKKVKILECVEERDIEIADRENHVGKVFTIKNGFPVVICGKGLVRILDIRMENGESILPWTKLKTKFL